MQLRSSATHNHREKEIRQTVEGRQTSWTESALRFVGVMAVVTVLILAFTHRPGPPCLIRLIWHFPCPGCGITRSLVCLCHGNVGLAMRYHPLGPPLFVLACVYLLVSMFEKYSITAHILYIGFKKSLSNPHFWSLYCFVAFGLYLVRWYLASRGSTLFLW